MSLELQRGLALLLPCSLEELDGEKGLLWFLSVRKPAAVRAEMLCGSAGPEGSRGLQRIPQDWAQVPASQGPLTPCDPWRNSGGLCVSQGITPELPWVGTHGSGSHPQGQDEGRALGLFVGQEPWPSPHPCVNWQEQRGGEARPPGRGRVGSAVPPSTFSKRAPGSELPAQSLTRGSNPQTVRS